MKNNGFTLIELLIAIAIVAILAAIAIPSYNGYIKLAGRADAMQTLADLRLEQEKWRLKNTSYTSTLSDLDLNISGGLTPNKRYTIAIPSASVSGFTATAAPFDKQVGDDCGTFAVNQDGPDHTGSYAGSACWRR